MTPREANDDVVKALSAAETAATEFMNATLWRDKTLADLAAAREVLEDVLRKSAGLDPRPDRREEYLVLHTFKAKTE